MTASLRRFAICKNALAGALAHLRRMPNGVLMNHRLVRSAVRLLRESRPSESDSVTDERTKLLRKKLEKVQRAIWRLA